MGNTRMNDILMDVLNGTQSGDPQAMLIAGLSAALLCILLLMLVIALIGRKQSKSSAERSSTVIRNTDGNRCSFGCSCQHRNS